MGTSNAFGHGAGCPDLYLFLHMRLVHRASLPATAGTMLAGAVDWLAALEDIELPDTYVPPAPADALRILLTLRGSAHFDTSDGPLVLEAGSLALLAPGWAYRRRTNAVRWHLRGLLLRGPWADRCARSCSLGSLVVPRPPPAWRAWIGEAVERALAQDRGWDAAVAARLASFAEALARVGDHGLVAQLAAAVDADPGRRWRVPELAAVCGLGVSGFAHRFRREAGLAPARWLLERRIAAAKRLLALAAPVAVARQLDFATPFHFSRAFRRIAGETPSAYRARLLMLG